MAAEAAGPDVKTRNDVPVSTTATMSMAAATSAGVAPIAVSPNGMATIDSPAAR